MAVLAFSYLSVASYRTLVSSFVLSRLDYCNSLFVNLPIETINRLQRLQNQAARITLRKPLREHVTPMLIQLHWLPVKARIEYKTAVLCFKCINNTAPSYLRDMLGEYVPSRPLRSANKRLLKPVTSKSQKVGGRAFSHHAPSLWNSLPSHLRELNTLSKFKTALKTYLFVKTFNV